MDLRQISLNLDLVINSALKNRTYKMDNTIFPWGHKRRFNSYAQYFKNIFG